MSDRPIQFAHLPRMRDRDVVGIDGIEYSGADLRRIISMAAWADAPSSAPAVLSPPVQDATQRGLLAQALAAMDEWQIAYSLRERIRAALAKEATPLAPVKDSLTTARDFPHNTCPASRLVQEISEAMKAGRTHPMLADDPEHCGESMQSVVESLWRARSNEARYVALWDAGLTVTYKGIEYHNKADLDAAIDADLKAQTP